MEKKLIDPMEMDERWLKGLTYRFAEKKEIEKNGRKTTVGIPQEVPLKKENVLTCTDYGTHVVVGKDGRKSGKISKKGVFEAKEEKGKEK